MLRCQPPSTVYFQAVGSRQAQLGGASGWNRQQPVPSRCETLGKAHPSEGSDQRAGRGAVATPRRRIGSSGEAGCGGTMAA